MSQVFSNSIVIFLMIFVGYLLTRRGILLPEHRHMLSFLRLNLTIPCAVIAGFDTGIDLLPLMSAFLITALGCLGLDLLSMALTRGQRGRDRAGALLLSNGYFAAPFTMPFVQVNMVPAATPIIAIFDMAQSFFNMGINYAFGTMLKHSEKRMGFHPMMILKALGRSVLVLTYVALLILTLLRLPIPALVRSFCEKVGAANLFLGMLFIGMVLDFRLDRRAVKTLAQILALRYGGALLLALLCFYVLPVDTLTARVLTLGFLSPVSNAALVYSDLLGCDMKVAGAAGSVSILISLAAFTGLFVLWA